MLWGIRDFKGIKAAEIDIDPGKATILTGVNSSGKSSVIQSLLLMAQSLHNGSNVVLNGPLVRLGEAQDLVREESENGAIEVTIGIASTPDDEEEDTQDLVAAFELTPSTDDRSSLRVRRVQIADQAGTERPFVMGGKNSRAADVALVMQRTAHLGSREVLHLKSLLGSERRQLRTYVVMQGLRPLGVAQILDPEEAGNRYRTLLEAALNGRLETSHLKAPAPSARIGGVAFIREFIRLFSQGAASADKATRELVAKFPRIRVPSHFDSIWNSFETRERELLIGLAAEARKSDPYVFVPVEGNVWSYGQLYGLLESQLIEKLGQTSTALEALENTLELLAGRVQYLGPLRDEPRVVWNHWNELALNLPVGTRGEYSAAVLSRSSATHVDYVTPASLSKTGPLSTAVNEWLAYLEIGEAVAARSQGKLGVGLDLEVNGHVRDLTSVGVGVSQALPLLVGILTSPQGAVFIVEQPELHLHPAVQARLADFLLVARPDLTLIIETHSESFITRVRRRAAEGTVNIDNIDIIFVEPYSGGSEARRLEITEFGDLSEWPRGFLSSAEEDVRAILKANIERSTVAHP